ARQTEALAAARRAAVVAGTAPLLGAERIALGGAHPPDRRLGAEAAGALLVRRARRAEREAALVDLLVAVVVLAVADLVAHHAGARLLEHAVDEGEVPIDLVVRAGRGAAGRLGAPIGAE